MHKLFRTVTKTGLLVGILSLGIHPASAGTEVKRMVVVLKPEAVSRWTPKINETVANLFPDQRVYANPLLWEAVSLKSASLVRELENRVAAKAFLAWGNKTHGFVAMVNQHQVDALSADPNVQAVFEDIPGQLASAAGPLWVNAPIVQYSTSTIGSPTTYTRGWNLKAINRLQRQSNN